MVKKLRISASQCGTFNICRRKWFFEKVAKLPRLGGNTAALAFGSAFHSVAERYLKADALGRDDSGDPVELYPENWRETDNGPITSEQAEQIKDLVELGIKSGALRRRRGREVEKAIELDLTDSIYLTGYIDVEYPDMVEDHKTRKSFTYTPGKKKLALDSQMLIYAKALLVWREEQGLPTLKQVTLRHNNFIKNPGDRDPVKIVEVKVTPEHIEKHWTYLKEVAAEMQEVAKTDKYKWDQIPEPESRAAACNAFGGCGYLNICNRVMSIDSFVYWLNQEKKESGAKDKMSSFADWLKNDEEDEEPPKQASPKPKKKTKEEPSKPNPPAPWALAACKACSGTGFNSHGDVCRACEMQVDLGDSRHPSNYRIEEQDGVLVAVLLDEPQPVKQIAKRKRTSPKVNRKQLEKEAQADDDAKGKPINPQLKAKNLIVRLSTESIGFTSQDISNRVQSLSDDEIDAIIRLALEKKVIRVIGENQAGYAIYSAPPKKKASKKAKSTKTEQALEKPTVAPDDAAEKSPPAEEPEAEKPVKTKKKGRTPKPEKPKTEQKCQREEKAQIIADILRLGKGYGGFSLKDLARYHPESDESLLDELIWSACKLELIRCIGGPSDNLHYGLVEETIKAEGFILCINCTTIGTLARPIGQVLAEIKKDNPEMWANDVNVFARRDALLNAGEAVAAKLSGVIVAEGLGIGHSDLRALVDGLKPFASHVITGVSG